MKLRVILQNPSTIKSLSGCDEDNTLTVQCIFVAKNSLLTPDLYPAPTRSKMCYDYFCWNSVAKYLKKKVESLEKLNCNLASETAKTTDCQNSGEFMNCKVCIQVSNYPFDICKFGALFPD